MHYSIAVITESQENLDSILDLYSSKEVEPYIIETREERIQRLRNIQDENRENKNVFGLVKRILAAKTDEELLDIDYDVYARYDQWDNEISTKNPHERWDWYEIGGRWDNYLNTFDKKSTFAEKIKNIDFSKSEVWKLKMEIIWYNNPPLKCEYSSIDDFYEKQHVFRTKVLITPDGNWHEGLSEEKQLEIIFNQNENYYIIIVDAHF